MASTLTKAIIGSTQSKYAAIAIFITILIVCIAFFISENDISISKKIISIITILLLALPGIILSLVELTCIVTGGTTNSKTWWCGVIAWVTTLFVILYSIMIITATINSLMTYRDANNKLKTYNSQKKLSKEEANDVADAIITANEAAMNEVDPVDPVVTVTSTPASVVVQPNIPEPPVVEQPTVTVVDQTGNVVSSNMVNPSIKIRRSDFTNSEFGRQDHEGL